MKRVRCINIKLFMQWYTKLQTNAYLCSLNLLALFNSVLSDQGFASVGK